MDFVNDAVPDRLQYAECGAAEVSTGRPIEAVLPKHRVLNYAVVEETRFDPEMGLVNGPAGPPGARPDVFDAILARSKEQSGLSLSDDAPPPQARHRCLRHFPPFL